MKSWTLGPWVRRRDKKKLTVALWGGRPLSSELCPTLLGTPGTYRRRASLNDSFESLKTLSDKDRANCDSDGSFEAVCEEPQTKPDDLLCGEDTFMDPDENKPPLEDPLSYADDIVYLIPHSGHSTKDPSPECCDDAVSQIQYVWKDLGICLQEEISSKRHSRKTDSKRKLRVSYSSSQFHS